MGMGVEMGVEMGVGEVVCEGRDGCVGEGMGVWEKGWVCGRRMCVGGAYVYISPQITF